MAWPRAREDVRAPVLGRENPTNVNTHQQYITKSYCTALSRLLLVVGRTGCWAHCRCNTTNVLDMSTSRFKDLPTSFNV